jgi:hypothetical protein
VLLFNFTFCVYGRWKSARLIWAIAYLDGYRWFSLNREPTAFISEAMLSEMGQRYSSWDGRYSRENQDLQCSPVYSSDQFASLLCWVDSTLHLSNVIGSYLMWNVYQLHCRTYHVLCLAKKDDSVTMRCTRATQFLYSIWFVPFFRCEPYLHWLKFRIQVGVSETSAHSTWTAVCSIVVTCNNDTLIINPVRMTVHLKAVCNTSIASCKGCPLDRSLVGAILFL